MLLVLPLGRQGLFFFFCFAWTIEAEVSVTGFLIAFVVFVSDVPAFFGPFL